MEFDEYGFSPYPDFFRNYNSQDHSQRLVIPSSYRKYYPTPLPQTAVLKKPEGNFWNVKWTISQENTISFEDGWHKFVADNGPIEGDCIYFTYDGFRTFWVRFFRNDLVVEPKAPIKIQEISDDEDETTSDDDHDMEEEEEDSHENMIISLSLGSSDEYEDADDVTTICEVNKAHHGNFRKGGSSQEIRCASIRDPEKYLDDPKNPFFISTSSCSRPVLVIATQVRKDYQLKFGRTINLIDGFGELKRKIGEWKDRVVVNKWDEIYKRNNANPEDTIICEIIRERGVVQSIKVHFVKK